MCVINVSSQRLELNAMYFKFGRLLLILLNLLLVLLMVLVCCELYGVVVFRDGGFTQWSAFSICSRSCGGGTRNRVRHCTNPAPSLGGRDCKRIGNAMEEDKCNERGCPVNGGFEKWSMFTECSVSCGKGVQKRWRFCIQPPPQFHGLDCSQQGLGEYMEERECNTQPCPVDGGYTTWSQWSHCSATCDTGLMTRTRTCSNPTPSYGGLNCQRFGGNVDEQECNKGGCPIDGNYGHWGQWSKCNGECGGGFRVRYRACDSPPPANGGKTCFEVGHGNPDDVKPCKVVGCDVDGGYGEWGNWGHCTVSCGDGRIERKRICNSPKPRGKGKTCKELGLGASIEGDDCNNQPC